jgi:nucleoside-diphosphate-sugar epimerase
MCRHFTEDFGLGTRVVRYHNVYGPEGTWDGGREKAPAAICRKVAQAKLGGDHEIEVWGDGEQTRSFTYITDCVHGTKALMASDHTAPVNLGSTELVTTNQLIDIVEEISGIKVEELRPERAAGRARPEQRQHAAQGRPRLGAKRHSPGGHIADVRLDLRPAEQAVGEQAYYGDQNCDRAAFQRAIPA